MSNIDKIKPARQVGITANIRGFFRRNPTEELTYRDICDKWGVADYVAHKVVQRMVRGGELESVHIIRVAK